VSIFSLFASLSLKEACSKKNKDEKPTFTDDPVPQLALSNISTARGDHGSLNFLPGLCSTVQTCNHFWCSSIWPKKSSPKLIKVGLDALIGLVLKNG